MVSSKTRFRPCLWFFVNTTSGTSFHIDFAILGHVMPEKVLFQDLKCFMLPQMSSKPNIVTIFENFIP